MVGTYSKCLHRMLYVGHRCFLPADDPTGQDTRFDEPELRPSPVARTHGDHVLAATLVQAARKRGVQLSNVGDPTATTGVLGMSEFMRLPYISIIDATALDAMHVVKDVVVHVVDTMKGERLPSKPKSKVSSSAESKDAKSDRDGKDAKSDGAGDDEDVMWQRCIAAHKRWTLSAEVRSSVDKKYHGLKAPTGLVDRSHLPFENTGKLIGC